MTSTARRRPSRCRLITLQLCLLLLALLSAVRCDVPADVDSPVPAPSGCTSIAVSLSASASVPLTTHTNDCADCDFRLSRVPSAVHPPGSRRSVYASRFAYPRYVGGGRGSTYLRSATATAVYGWRDSAPIGSIAQVSRTYAYIDGAYGVVNEAGLAMGESTCAGRLVARPLHVPGGTALFDISELSRVAMERCSTAHCAIDTMGALAERHGYYGAEWEGEYARGEAGEALTIADTRSAWLFHITPDDTGRSAVWAAQRVPDGHVAVVSNAFTIQRLNLSDAHNFRASSNVYAVAERLGWYNRSTASEPLNFARVYGAKVSFEVYCSRRSWRVMSLLAPSLASALSPDAGVLQLPFSVRVDRPVAVRDLFAVQRDHYENTSYDLTRGAAAGPYGNPNRYDRGSASGVPMAQLMQGTFERPISMFRTAYSTVTESVSGGLARVWYGAGAPHATVYVPVWAAAGDVPVELGEAAGSLYRWQDGSTWWLVTAVANWMERMYCHISVDVARHQQRLERAAQRTLDTERLHGNDSAALQRLQSQLAANATQHWRALFYHLVAKYHDGYRVDNFSAETIQPTALFYPRDWLVDVGYWGQRGQQPDTTQTSCRRNSTHAHTRIHTHTAHRAAQLRHSLRSPGCAARRDRELHERVHRLGQAGRDQAGRAQGGGRRERGGEASARGAARQRRWRRQQRARGCGERRGGAAGRRGDWCLRRSRVQRAREARAVPAHRPCLRDCVLCFALR